MTLRRWLLTSAALCGVVGLATLTLALLCIVEVVGGQCELWLLGPLLALPLGLGLGLIGRAAGRPTNCPASCPTICPTPSESPESVESEGCGEREEA